MENELKQAVSMADVKLIASISWHLNNQRGYLTFSQHIDLVDVIYSFMVIRGRNGVVLTAFGAVTTILGLLHK